MSNLPAPSANGRISPQRAPRPDAGGSADFGAGRGTVRRSPAAAFTLLELLIVITIISFLAIITLPNITSTVRSFQLTQGGQELESQLQSAREQALARNRIIEMRFYTYQNKVYGQSAQTFQAFQPFVISTSTTGALTAVPLDKPTYLPTNIIMDSGATLSSLLASPQVTTAYKQLLNPQMLSVSGTAYSSVAFQFKPDGSTNLATTSPTPWFVTLHNHTDGDALSKPPTNFYTIQVDPYNGHIYDFRP